VTFVSEGSLVTPSPLRDELYRVKHPIKNSSSNQFEELFRIVFFWVDDRYWNNVGRINIHIKMIVVFAE